MCRRHLLLHLNQTLILKFKQNPSHLPQQSHELVSASRMEEDGSRRKSSRTRMAASKMTAALESSDNRARAVIARLEARENDNAGLERVQVNDDDEASFDDDDDLGYGQNKQLKGTKRKTRQAKALENSRKAPKTFLEILHEMILYSFVSDLLVLNQVSPATLTDCFVNRQNLESLPPHVPSYLRSAVGLHSSTSGRHFCTVCGFAASYTCVRCGLRFCSCRCQNIHNDTRCLKFVA